MRDGGVRRGGDARRSTFIDIVHRPFSYLQGVVVNHEALPKIVSHDQRMNCVNKEKMRKEKFRGRCSQVHQHDWSGDHPINSQEGSLLGGLKFLKVSECTTHRNREKAKRDNKMNVLRRWKIDQGKKNKTMDAALLQRMWQRPNS